MKTIDDAEISYVLSRPDADVTGCVLLVHGLGGQKNSDTNLALVDRLAEQNIATLRFDFPGHGDSGGSTRDLTIGRGADVVSGMFEELQRQIPSVPVGLVGASYGASSILSSSILGDVAAIVLRSPISDYAAVRARQLGPEKMKEWEKEGVIGGLISRGRRTPWAFYEEAQKLNLIAKAATHTTPLLIVQGTKDLTVPMGQSQNLREAWGGCADLVQIENGDHALEAYQHTDLFVGMCQSWFKTFF